QAGGVAGSCRAQAPERKRASLRLQIGGAAGQLHAARAALRIRYREPTRPAEATEPPLSSAQPHRAESTELLRGRDGDRRRPRPGAHRWETAGHAAAAPARGQPRPPAGAAAPRLPPAPDAPRLPPPAAGSACAAPLP